MDGENAASLWLKIILALMTGACALFFFLDYRHRRKWESLMDKKELTMAELRCFKGLYGSPIYISLAGIIFDVSKGADFYRKGMAYHVYAGQESGRALGHMSLGKPIHNVHMRDPLVDDLQDKQRKILADWIAKFKVKYPVVATLVGTKDGGKTNIPLFDKSFYAYKDQKKTETTSDDGENSSNSLKIWE